MITGIIFSNSAYGEYSGSNYIGDEVSKSASIGFFDTTTFVTAQKREDNFVLSSSGESAPLYISTEDWPGVIRAFTDLQTDIDKVTGAGPLLFWDILPA
jgi:hypothetical protein